MVHHFTSPLPPEEFSEKRTVLTHFDERNFFRSKLVNAAVKHG